MGKKLTIEHCKKWINDNNLSSIYSILEYIESENTYKILDINRNIIFNIHFSIFKNKLLSNNFDYKFFMTKDEIENKKLETMKKNGTKRLFEDKERFNSIICKTYGVDNPSKSEMIKLKKINKSIEVYGTENVFQSDIIKEKIIETNMKKYGVSNPQKNKEIREKTQDTNYKKYGCKVPTQNTEIYAKVEKTNIKKYGSKACSQNKEIIEKIKQTKIKNGTLIPVNLEGKIISLNEYFCCDNNIQLSYTRATQLLKEKKFSLEELLEYSKNTNKTSIEYKIEQILKKYNIDFIFNKKLINENIKPDFYIPNKNVVIECDGLYWHSELIVDKNYHKNKKAIYDENNIRSLFFRENEILYKSDIVESIIINKLQINSNKYYARNLEINTNRDFNFFKENHLMGIGKGDCVSLVDKKTKDIVCSIQYKWINKAEKTIEISRFCCKKNTTIVGGFSKLINYIEKNIKPKKIITYIDKRYGEGSYLNTIGFKKKNNSNISFSWTDGKNTYHRMKFKNDFGYNKKLYKIWDCGQDRYEKDIV